MLMRSMFHPQTDTGKPCTDLRSNDLETRRTLFEGFDLYPAVDAGFPDVT